MSWLKNSSIGASLGKLRSSNLPSNECDPSACYNSFKKHWQQIHEIIEKTKAVGNILKTDDDFLSVVNNLKKLVTFLSMELRSSHVNKPCLDYLLSQNLLDQLYTWSESTGRYGDTLKMQQMQLYEGLVDHSGAQLLIHEPFHRPLLKLLNTCSSQLFTVEVQKCLVVLLNQLCVSIYCQNELLDLFFFVGNPSRFIIFSLLLPFVHREGAIGQQARDALLLCVGLSSRNNAVAEFICRDSNFCQDLAAVLCCLYSGLPRKLNDIEVADWHRFTPDDITEMPELEHFLNVLEFCNAVVQVAHPIVCEKLVQLLHGAFLCRVMGPALLQESVGVSLQGYDYSAPLQLSTEEELATATAYFDLFLRSLSEPGLLNSFVKFLLKDTYEDQRIIDCVVMRIKSKTRLCVVTLSLLETLVELNCEDVMLELVLRHLVPCTHVMLSQRPRVAHVDPYCRSAQKFLSLAPAIPRHEPVDGSLYGNYQAYLFDARNKINNCAMATSCWTYQYDGENPPFTGMPLSRTEDSNANQKLNTESESADHSLPSADDGSSGYESFAALKDGGRDFESGGECESPCERGENHSDNNFTSDNNLSVNSNTTGNCDVKNNGSSDITSVNNNGNSDSKSVKNNGTVATGISDVTSVKNNGTVATSNIDVLGSLKGKIEDKLVREPNVNVYIADAQKFLLEREERLVNTRKHAIEAPLSLPPSSNRISDAFERGDSKRRSLSLALSSVFKRQFQPPNKESVNNFGIARFTKERQKETEIRNVVMCAVILDEWLKELAAITQEHTAHNVRPDGRSLMKVRPATINVGSISTADGSAVVKIGRTTVVCGIKAELATPKPSQPQLGFVVANVELPPLCSATFRPGPPSDIAQTMTSMLGSIVDSCGLIDLSQLCVSKEHLVWILHCDIVCLDYSGSVMDAVLIALVAALRTVALPEATYCVETKSFSVDLQKRTPLKVDSSPVSTTFATIDESNIIADPTVEEERLSNGSGTAYSETDLQKCISLSKDRAVSINKMMETALNNREP
ncbi:hypothetical protein LSTR_LSTR003451 [Laodelphax striatellus]|uniref:Exoribonuclease phosphorolytic domain-containing protein n=1 Tax=Laodelphax striatellus TaxID=195883 RepID=A0A482WYN5_LAOST|nr:hypothetical protein LSTR_LSTR003451 [Laodelphax striatellus]